MSLDPIVVFHAIGVAWSIVLGSVIGSFVNVCVHRIPWQKSILWPGSHCLACLQPVAARDNVPVLAWLWLRGRCRNCGAGISARYPLIELIVGLLFAAVYLTDVAPSGGRLDGMAFARMAYHDALVTLLVIATFIDAEHFIIPDQVTVPGMVLGLAVGALVPGIRPEPALASTPLGGLVVGLWGWAVGGGQVWAVRIVARFVFRKEAMGFGDVTLMAMIGAFLGWQAAVLTFFLAPFFGLAQALVKLARLIAKRLAGRRTHGADHELPFGPYLSLAALTLVLTWPWLWPNWARPLFSDLADVFGWMILGK
jgi:leader peptidase (prepilin peptidase)/N-methyltransferase